MIEGSHGRNSNRIFKQKPWRNVACWLAQARAQLASYTARHHLARAIAAHSGLGALMSINNQDSYVTDMPTG